MRAIGSFVILLCLLLPTGRSFAQYLLVTDSLQISTTSTFDSVRVTSSGVLIADDSIAVLGNMIIDSGGVITHSLRLLAGLRLNVLGMLEVKSGGTIDVTGKGLLGGPPTPGGSPGEAYNPSGDSIVAGATGSPETGGGGSYGGRGGSGSKGGVSNEPYGLIEDVRHVGAGGGGIHIAWGGHGGGLIVINASTCIVDGTIRANGGEGFAGFDNSGAGSGGGIRIDIGNLSGTGIIEAQGGVAYTWDVGGAGGGGRIAIFYDVLNIPTENILVQTGTEGAAGSAGTIYLKDNAQSLGSVIFGNNNIDCLLFTPWRSAFPNFQKLTLRNRAKLRTIVSDNTTFGEVSIESNSTFLLDTNTAVQTPVVNIVGGTLTTMVDRSFPIGTDLQLSDGGTINVQNNRTLSLGVFDTTNIHSGTVNMTDGTRLDIAANTATIGQDVTLVKDGTFGASDSVNTLTINNGGVITNSLRLLRGLQLNVLGMLEVKTGGAIDVSGKGLLGGPPTPGGSPGEAYNPSGDSIVAGATGSPETGGGGSYGGRGGSGSKGGVSNEPYGLIEDVRHVGAGGGGINAAWGGHGGGLILINATTCTVDGTIRANGGEGFAGFDNSGAGSGGGIRIDIGNLSGTGIIEALGGVAYTWDVGGSGGGGRIAIFYDVLNIPTENILVHTGTEGAAGSAGTIYLKDNAQPLGSVIFGNNDIDCPFFTPWRSAFPSFKRLTLRKRAQLRTIASNNSTFGEVSVESNSTFILDTNTAVQTPVVNIAGGTMTTLVDRSFPVGADLQLSDGGTINVQNNRTLSVGVFDTTNIRSGTVNMTDGTRLDIAANEATISQGVTLVKDGTFGASDSVNTLTINNGGVITNSLRLLRGLQLNVLGTLEVKSGGAIDVSGKGLLGGPPTIGGSPGEAYNPSGDSIIAGATGSDETGGGGSYGGRGGSGSKGGVSNEPYGLIEDVRHVGAGGGGINAAWGGHGGGLILINATTCIVDGTIRANGGEGFAGFDNSGAGSGGGIRIDIGNLSGTGIIEALGGVAYTWDVGGSGGGGRIAIFYDVLNIPTENILVHTGTEGAAGSAGTIYLKDNAQIYGDLIVENGNLESNLITPLRTLVQNFESILIRNEGFLEVPDGYTKSQGYIRLQNGKLYCWGVLRIENTPLIGSGTIFGSFINSGELNPGDEIGGSLNINGSYTQASSGNLNVELGGTTPCIGFDCLLVDGIAILDGVLNINYTNGFVPSFGDRFQFLTFQDVRNDFSSINGWDDYSLFYFDSSAALIADYNYTLNSTADQQIILSPSGDIPFEATLLDNSGSPAVGSRNVWLDFSDVAGVFPCPTQLDWPIVDPEYPADEEGKVRFFLNAIGCSTDSLKVMSSFGMISKVPIRSLDPTAGFYVTAQDFDGSSCNDYNSDGIVDFADWDYFVDFLGQTCIDVPENYFHLRAYTIPGPGAIYQGDTIQVCGKVINTLPAPAIIDSINFFFANWGIAQTWTEFGQLTGIPIGPRDTVTLCQSFVIPESHHGCFQVRIYPRYVGIDRNLAKIEKKRSQTFESVLSWMVPDYKMNGLVASEIVQMLRDYEDVPINFIYREIERPIRLQVKMGTVKDVLDQIVSQDSSYQYEIVNGRLIMYPTDTKYHVSIANFPEIVLPRFDAAYEYVGFLNNHYSDFSTLLPPNLLGNPNARAFTDIVKISGNLRIVEHLVQLLGDDTTLTIAIVPAATKLPQVAFYKTKKSLNIVNCTNCRPIGLAILQSGPSVQCESPNCGTAKVNVLEKIETSTCLGQPQADCAGDTLKEEIRVLEGCGIAGSVMTGEGCPILPGGKLEGRCSDTYLVCNPPGAIPRGTCEIAWIQNYYVCGRLLQVNRIVWVFTNDDQGCRASEPFVETLWTEPPPPCTQPPRSPGRRVQINRDARRPPQTPLASSTMKEFNRGNSNQMFNFTTVWDTTTFNVPVGSEFGDTLALITRAFIPPEWSYTISNGNSIITPDTITVKIIHDTIVGCNDTARVILHAYNALGELAGNAELLVHVVGKKGDMDGDEMVDLADLSSMISYLYGSGPSPDPVEVADLNGDTRIDIADLTKFVDHFYGSQTPLSCVVDSSLHDSITVFVDTSQLGDSTTVVFQVPVPLKGISFEFLGDGISSSVIFFSDSLDVVRGLSDTLLFVGILDTNGSATIAPNQQLVMKLSGRYRLSSVIVSDMNYYSHPGRLESLSDVSDQNIGIPLVYFLYHGYPNPFNPSTTIRYDLPEEALVKLKVYNVLGQEVASLVNEVKDSGSYETSWDASGMASGVYLYRLQAGGYVDTKKILLLK